MYRNILDWLRTPQSEPTANENQIANSAGGYAYAVDDWKRLDRFLILGSEGGSYYATGRKLTRENAEAVLRCIAEDGARVVRRIVEISDAGRAPKNDPAIFALALAAGLGDEATRQAALGALPQVCRTAAHLFAFAGEIEGVRGWGRGLRRAVARWYTQMPMDRLILQVIKYQGRGGQERWSHRDLLRLAHPVADAEDGARRALFDLVCRPDAAVPDLPALAQYAAARRLASVTDAQEAATLIRAHRLPRETVPTAFLNDRRVWRALLDDMPMTAMLRALGKMSAVDLLAPFSEAEWIVADRLGDDERLRRARVHPMQLLIAARVYGQGHGELGRLRWQPSTSVVAALEAAFYRSFGTVVPTGRRILVALDVSGSMSMGSVARSSLTPREAGAALALVTLATERRVHLVAFQDRLVPLALSPRMRLADAVAATERLPFGSTDCAQPMLYALERKLEVDAFVVLTDSETWAGNVHPVQALREYRRKTGIAAKLAVVGMVSNGFSIADPDDAGMLDLVGFDTATPQLLSDFVADRL